MPKLIPLFQLQSSPPQAKALFWQHPELQACVAFELAPLAPANVRAIRNVNRYVNESIAYMPNERVDRWTVFPITHDKTFSLLSGDDMHPVGQGFGDCDDYAWTKYAALSRHFGLGCLLPLIVRPLPNSTVLGNRMHMVLGIQCQDKTLILDNFTDDVIELHPQHRPWRVYHGGKWKTCHVVSSAEQKGTWSDGLFQSRD